MKVEIPGKYRPLFDPSRFKVYYGGRGSGKSYQFTRALLIKAHTEPGIRILCTREIQRSIADSVHRLIADQIQAIGMSELFEIQNNYIKHVNGSYFLFEGLAHNITKIKSMAGIKYCWVEEAEGITEKSWDILIPTIREPGSEIWASLNPDRDDDPTYKRFITQKLDNCILQKVNWQDNPWFPDVLKQEMETCKATNYSKYLHIWEGEPITDYASLVYRFDRKINEIDDTPRHVPGVETIAGWDFGVQDDTAVIVMQLHQVPKSTEYPRGVKITVIDELVTNNKEAQWYRQQIDRLPYRIDAHYCDPSGASRDSSLQSWVSKIGYNFDWTHSFSPAEMIDASNDYLHAVRINRHHTPKTYAMFTHWQYKTDRNGIVTNPPKPIHDEFSHPGTAFYFALVNRFPPRSKGGGILIGT